MRTAKTDQTVQMPRLIRVFPGRTFTLLVLSCRGSFVMSEKMSLLQKSDIMVIMCRYLKFFFPFRTV